MNKAVIENRSGQERRLSIIRKEAGPLPHSPSCELSVLLDESQLDLSVQLRGQRFATE